MIRTDIFNKIVKIMISKGSTIHEALEIVNVSHIKFITHISPEQRKVITKFAIVVQGAITTKTTFEQVVAYINSSDIKSTRGYIRAYKAGILPDGFPRKLESYIEYNTSSLFDDNRKKQKIAKAIKWCTKEEFISYLEDNNIKSVRTLRTLLDKGELPNNVPYKAERIKALYDDIDFGNRKKQTIKHG